MPNPKRANAERKEFMEVNGGKGTSFITLEMTDFSCSIQDWMSWPRFTRNTRLVVVSEGHTIYSRSARQSEVILCTVNVTRQGRVAGCTRGDVPCAVPCRIESRRRYFSWLIALRATRHFVQSILPLDDWVVKSNVYNPGRNIVSPCSLKSL